MMTRTTPSTSAGLLALAACVLLAAGCDNGTAGPSSLDSPIISNFLIGRDDTLPCPSDEKPRAASIDYTDPQGDVRGGSVEIEFKRGPISIDEIHSTVPSGPVTITGTTAGQVKVRFCVETVGAEVDAIIVLTDVAGNRSNELKATVNALTPAS
jgi:hypothetical protein